MANEEALKGEASVSAELVNDAVRDKRRRSKHSFTGILINLLSLVYSYVHNHFALYTFNLRSELPPVSFFPAPVAPLSLPLGDRSAALRSIPSPLRSPPPSAHSSHSWEMRRRRSAALDVRSRQIASR